MFRKLTILTFAVLCLAVSLLSACGSDESADSNDSSETTALPTESGANGATAVPEGVNLVEPVEASKLISEPGVQLIDLRTPEEFDEGHIAGAEMIDFYAADFGDEIAKLDRDGQYVIYCRSGNRSGQTAVLMQSLGFTNVADVNGGILAWEGAGLDVEK
ncbi:MAG: rhodanese-like domain-containing protein [Acidimicrobiia bacterium]|nr:rhodanese-like domain-containing protein [Acidimicrobiia bacterium]